jgi:hypothetical protein
MNIAKNATSLIAHARQCQPWVVNRYEVPSSQEGRIQNWRDLWASFSPDTAINEAVIAAADASCIAAAKKSGRYVEPFAHGEDVGWIADTALNHPDWEHVGQSFGAMMKRHKTDDERKSELKEMILAEATPSEAERMVRPEVIQAACDYLHETAL